MVLYKGALMVGLETPRRKLGKFFNFSVKGQSIVYFIHRIVYIFNTCKRLEIGSLLIWNSKLIPCCGRRTHIKIPVRCVMHDFGCFGGLTRNLGVVYKYIIQFGAIVTWRSAPLRDGSGEAAPWALTKFGNFTKNCK